MPAPANEAHIIDAFINNTQTAHRTVVTNSVGMAILYLRKTYFKASHTETDITQKYEHAIAEIQLAAKDKIDRTHAVNFLISGAEEATNEWDAAHLYLPTGKGTYQKKTFIFPLKLVIPLVWLALKDHDKFAHDINYQGTKEQQFARARGEYNMRRDNFLNLLVDLYTNSICHQGVRNEMVFLLNKIYFGIEIIEDELSTISATLKDNTNSLFWEHYQKATPHVKKSLTSALFIWMSEYNPKPLLTLIDPENKAHGTLHALFLRHGSDPEGIKLNHLIETCLPTLNFNYDPTQYPVIKLIENIFNSAAEDNNEDIKRAIENIKIWIKLHVVLDDLLSTETLTAFYTLYEAYKSIDQRTLMLLRATGNMHDCYSELITACEVYFTNIADANLENEFLVASTDLLQIAQQLKLSIIECKSAKMADFIENFLARWHIATREGDYTELKDLYRYLIDEIFQTKIILRDEEIDLFWHQADNSTPFRDITVYLINRIFLHAIILEPNEWSEKFGNLMRETLSFISGDCNNLGNPNLNRNLIETSYPMVLTAILRKREARFRGRDMFNLKDCYILLPQDVKSFEQWDRLANLLSDEKFSEIYQPRAVKINQILYSYYSTHNTHQIDNILFLIPLAFRRMFLLDERVKTFVENSLSNDNAKTLAKAINNCIPEAERITIWNALSPHAHEALRMFLTFESFKISLKSLPDSDKLTFLETVCSPANLDTALSLLPSAPLLTILMARGSEAANIFLKPRVYRIISKFNLTQKIELVQFLKTQWTSEFINKNVNFLEKIAESFGAERVKLIEYLSIINFNFDAKKLLNNMHYWRQTFYKIPVEHRFIFLIFFGYINYRKLFPEHHNLQSIADSLTPDEFYSLSDHWYRLITTYISSSSDTDSFGNHIITKILTNLPEDKRSVVLKDHINLAPLKPVDYENLPSILSLLPTSQRYEVAVLKGCINPCNPIQLKSILELIPEDRHLDYLKTLGSDYIINSIMTEKISWSELESVVPRTVIDHLQNEFVQTFAAIYTSLRAGQASFFKTYMVAQLNILKIKPVDAITRILEHARLHPNSRTEQALALMKKFSCLRSSNTDLLKKIYLYGYSKSGLFKRSYYHDDFSVELPYRSKTITLVRGVSFSYRSKTVARRIHSGFFDADFIKQNPNSRRAKIYNSLNPENSDRQGPSLWPK